MLQGMTTQNVFADDVKVAADWDAQVFGIKPYFEKEFSRAVAYVELRVRGDSVEERAGHGEHSGGRRAALLANHDGAQCTQKRRQPREWPNVDRDPMDATVGVELEVLRLEDRSTADHTRRRDYDVSTIVCLR